jgi:uncharacterized protein (TIGR03382 family)
MAFPDDGEGVELAANTATLAPGTYQLAITGLSQNTLATPVAIAIEPAPEEPAGCCSSSGDPGVSPALALVLVISWRRRRRSRTVQPCTSGWRS